MAETNMTNWECDHCLTHVDTDLGERPIGWAGVQLIHPVETLTPLTMATYHLCAACEGDFITWLTENWPAGKAPVGVQTLPGDLTGEETETSVTELEEEPAVEEEVVDDGTEPEPEPAP